MADNERMRWFSPETAPFVLEGFPFFESERRYRRLPLNTDEPMPEWVEALAWNTAGGKLRFHAKLKKLAVRVRLTEGHSYDHLTADGQCGFDCYADDGSGKRFYAVSRFDRSKTEYESVFFAADRQLDLELEINFPLYSGISDVMFGFDWDAEISAPKKRGYGKRIVVYGSSITQGGCATRPGMAYTNILSRRLDAEIINLGFSGSGRAEAEVAREISKIENVGLLLLDCEANCHDTEWVESHYPEFIRILRERYPDVPMLVLSASPKTNELYNAKELELRLANKRFERELVEGLRAGGDEAIRFMDYEEMLGAEWMEETVDGCHATDLGFLYMANGLEPVLREMLGL